MARQEAQSNAQARKALAEQLWLHYYNSTLFARGLITEQARNRMADLIQARRSANPEQ